MRRISIFPRYDLSFSRCVLYVQAEYSPFRCCVSVSYCRKSSFVNQKYCHTTDAAGGFRRLVVLSLLVNLGSFMLLLSAGTYLLPFTPPIVLTLSGAPYFLASAFVKEASNEGGKFPAGAAAGYCGPYGAEGTLPPVGER